MDKLIGYIQVVCCSLLLCTSCIKDGMDKDCGAYIRFVYNYNLEYTDLFHKQATRIHLYVFDKNGVYVTELKETPGQFAPDYLMPLPESLRGSHYTLIAWSGLYDESYEKNLLTPGVSTLEELEIRASNLQTRAAKGCIDRQLHPLWHGKNQEMAPQFTNDITTVSLLKNTNHFRIVMQSLDNAVMRTEDYDIRILSPNGRYNHANELQGNDEEEQIAYSPYYTANDEEAGAIAEMNTLRLLTDKDNRLVITHRTTGNTILDIPLNRYLNALRLQQYAHMPLQEYLDRADKHSIVFFFKGMDHNGHYLSVDVQINDWLMREQEVG